jgi:hypothetical protein
MNSDDDTMEQDQPEPNSIPVLEDVVSPGVPTDSGNSPYQGMDQLDDAALGTLGEALALQLMGKLDTAIQISVDSAVEQASSNLQQVIKDELHHSLQKRLHEMLKAAIQEHLGHLERIGDKEG